MLGIIMTVVFIIMLVVCLLGTGIAQRKAAWWLVDVIGAVVVFYISASIGYELDKEDPISIVVAIGLGMFFYYLFISPKIKKKFFSDLIEFSNNQEQQTADQSIKITENNSENDVNKNKLKVLKELLDDNIISYEEFENRKAKILDEITNNKVVSRSDEKISSNVEAQEELDEDKITNEFESECGATKKEKNSLYKDVIILILVLIVCVIGIIFLVDLSNDKQNTINDKSAVNQESEVKTKEEVNISSITSQEAIKMVSNNFLDSELRYSTNIYASDEPDTDIDGEMYYQVEMRESMGHLMGIYYVEQNGKKIYLSDYYTNALELVYGELDKNKVKMISYDELKSILRLNNIPLSNEIELFYHEGQYYYSMFCIENGEEVFYWLEVEGDKLWKLDYSTDKILIWEK